MPDDQQAGVGGRHIWSNRPGPAEQEVNHSRIVADWLAVLDQFAVALSDGTAQVEFAGDHRLGEIPFADKIWDDIDVLAFGHPQNLAQARFLFPKGAIDLAKNSATDDFIRVLERRSTGVRI